MFKKILIPIGMISLYIISCLLIYNGINKGNIEKTIHTSKPILNQIVKVKDDIFAVLFIPKIQLKKNVYNLNDKRNNVEQNVTLLKESILFESNPHQIFLAAHSGTGEKAIFTRLDELVTGDYVYLEYQNQMYSYRVEKIEEQEKNGTIRVKKGKENELILTTCSEQNPKNQLIVTCIEQK